MLTGCGCVRVTSYRVRVIDRYLCGSKRRGVRRIDILEGRISVGGCCVEKLWLISIWWGIFMGIYIGGS